MDRDRIDWENLTYLPRKKREGASVEDLAARRFNMNKAAHKGRCHITNQKRRQIAQEKVMALRKANAIKAGKFRALKDRVRAFWAGEIDEHP